MDKQTIIEAMRQIEKEKEDKKLAQQNAIKKIVFWWFAGNGVALIVLLIWFTFVVFN